MEDYIYGVHSVAESKPIREIFYETFSSPNDQQHKAIISAVSQLLSDTLFKRFELSVLLNDNDKNLSKDALDNFKVFVDDISQFYTQRTGVRYGVFLSDDIDVLRESIRDSNNFLDQYPMGQKIYPCDSGLCLYGYNEMPQPVSVPHATIQSFIDEYVDSVRLVDDLGFKINLADVQEDLNGPYPENQFMNRIQDYYIDKYFTNNEDLNNFRIDCLPFVDLDVIIDSVNNSFFDKIPFDYYLNQKVPVVLMLKDNDFPLYDDGLIREDSSAAWLAASLQDTQFSYSDICKSLKNELKSFGPSSDEYLITFPVMMPIADLLDDSKVAFKIPANTRCGFFNKYSGEHGRFGVPISRELGVMRSAASVYVDGADESCVSLSDVCGKSIFKPRNIQKEQSLYNR